MQETSLFSEMLQPSLTPDQLVGRNILLATDFSHCSARATGYALGIASRYESPLYLFHCVDPTPYNFVDPGAVQTALDDARRELEQVASDLRREYGTKNVQTKVIVEAGNLTVILPQAVKQLDLGLIVVGTHGRTGWRKMILGSVTEMVVDQASCPVLCVGPSADRTRIQEFGPESILLAGEGSAGASLARSYALSLAQKYRSRLTTIDVLENRLGRVRAKVSQLEWQDREVRSDTHEGAATSPTQLPAELGTQTDLILQLADDTSADLIVLAVPEMHRFTDRFLSTDSYRVVCGAACPVLTVGAR